MIEELATQYGTQALWAVFKRENRRSIRLLTRLGFALATATQHFELDAEPDESVMRRRIAATTRCA